MILSAGTRFGPYEVVAALGAGGMGEVYKALDTRLDRVVAIKVLSGALAGGPKFRERFEREARAISQLDHPHICTLYDVGEERGTSYLVMQYLEGQTLAERLARAAQSFTQGMPLDEALTLAAQIADALDEAHRHGITHRDLKPANVMVTRNGAKLLDFGLAKAAALPGVTSNSTAPPTSPPTLTVQGAIMGTFQYMAPEQLEGRNADARADIFAFGAVLYEMVTGRKAFEARSHASLITAVMSTQPPPIATHQPFAPPSLQRIIKKCLAKDPEERWQSARDLKDELMWVRDNDSSIATTHSPTKDNTNSVLPGRARLAWIAAALCLLSTIVALMIGRAGYLQPRLPIAPAYLSSILLPGDFMGVAMTAAEALAVAPDGKHIVFVGAAKDRRRRLFLRPIDGLKLQPLLGTEDAGAPFWSPDSRFVGFLAQGKLKRVDISGGIPVILADATDASGFATGSWGPDDTILFTPKQGPLYRISASGGVATPVTTLDAMEAAHAYPIFLPGGVHFVYLAVRTSSGVPSGTLYIASVNSQEKRPLLQVNSNVKYALGYLLFLRNRTLMAQPFDADRLQLNGEAAPIAEQIETGFGLFQSGAFSVSDNGLLVYRAGTDEVRSQLQWLDRSGKPMSTVGEPLDQMSLQLSMDGKRAAVSALDTARNTRDLWTYEIARGLRTRFTFDAADEIHALWSSVGDQIIFNSRRTGRLDLFQKPFSGTGVEKPLYSDGLNNLYPTSLSADGRFLLYYNGNATSRTGNDIWALPLSGDPKPQIVVQTEFNDTNGQFSPDGRWVAYQSNESGRMEVYVVAFPGSGGKRQVSNGGGGLPRWNHDGREIFYLDPEGKLKAATVNGLGQVFEIGTIHTLFEMRSRLTAFGGAGGYSYDVAPGGRQFLINTVHESASTAPFTLVVNWTAGLK